MASPEELECVEEQEMEVEALSSILESRFKTIDDACDQPSSTTESSGDGGSGERRWYGVEVHPFEDEPDEEEQPVAIALMLLFRFRPLYPASEGPELRLCAESGISDADAATVQSSLEASVPDLLGMAMIYEMTERIKEEVRTIVRAKAPAAASGAGASASEAATHSTAPGTETSGSSFAESMRAAEAEAERLREMRRIGTLVTREVFTEWKRGYADEMLRETEEMKRDTAAVLVQRAANTNDVTLSGLTGKEFFVQGKHLAGKTAGRRRRAGEGAAGGNPDDVDADENAEDGDFAFDEDEDFDEEDMLDALADELDSDDSDASHGGGDD